MPGRPSLRSCFVFFNDTATTEIYTLSLHDALPIYERAARRDLFRTRKSQGRTRFLPDRKSTRLNSSHLVISYAVFCLKTKKIRQWDGNNSIVFFRAKQKYNSSEHK